ncbi:MAG: sulfatase [Thermoanaerobaculia bacterium]
MRLTFRRPSVRPTGRFAGVAILAGLAALSVLGGCARPRSGRVPNGIVVIVIDTLRADHVGLYGSRWPATPQIDSLGPESVRFEQAYSQASWTRPSVPSLFTGLYPSEHGITGFDEESGRVVRGQILSDDAMTLAEGMKAAGYRTALAGYQYQLSVKFNQQQGFDFYRNNLSGGSGEINRTFLDWLDQEPQKPFFVYLHYLDIHWPYCPSDSVRGRFDRTPTAFDTCDEKGARALRTKLASGALPTTAGDRRALDARYSEKLFELDSGIGSLFDELKRRGRWDDSLIVVTADHGQEFGDHGGFDHGTSLYDELLHVPFVWKLPSGFGSRRGRALPQLIEIRSLLPTLFDLVGLPTPKGVSAPSLIPWIEDRAPAVPPVDFIAAESNGFYGVRDARWKLVVQPNPGKVLLFDLAADPFEQTDVSATQPAALAAMQAKFRHWRAGLKPLPSATAALDAETAAGLRSLGYLK